MTDNNPRYAFTVPGTVFQRPYERKTDFVCDLVGRCCESGILSSQNTSLRAAPVAISTVCTTGAYNYSMASNYSRLPAQRW